MAGTGIYLVGQDATYDTLQAAVDALVSDQGASTFTKSQDIVIVDNRSYAGCSIPNSLTPTSAFRLTIRKAPGTSPVISGTVDRLNAWIGVLVDAVPYVTVQQLKIKDFASAGVVFSQSDFCEVVACNVSDNLNFGVQFHRSDFGSVFNTRGAESLSVISLIRSVELVLINNSLVTTQGGRSCLAINYVPEEEGLLDQTVPLVYSYNNIMVSNGLPPMEMPQDHEKTLVRSDGNVYYSGTGAVANLFEIIQNRRVDHYVRSIEEWQRVTGSEENSVFANPEFVTTPAGRPAPGLILENGSPVAKLGLTKDQIEELGIPSWVDLNRIDVDADDNPRDPSSPTPGSAEILTAQDWEYLGFVEATSEERSTSETLVTGADRAVSHLQRSLDCWFPKVATGYFYMGDAAFYLYSSKLAKKLQDITWSKVQVPVPMNVVSARIGETSTTEDLDMPEVSWFQSGKDIWVNHSGATISKPVVESVRVYGEERTWNSSEQAFDVENRFHTFGVVDNPREYYLPSCPEDSAPIVITDESLTNQSSRDIVPLEYNVAWDRPTQRMRVTFQGEKNLFYNPHFHTDTSDWVDTLQSGTLSAAETSSALVGDYNAKVVSHVADIGYSYLKQDVYRTDLNKDLLFSFHVRNNSGGAFTPVVTTYRSDGSVHGEQVVGTVTGPEATSDIDWKRYVVFCKARTDSVLGVYGSTYEESFNADLRTVNDETAPRVRFELRVTAGGTSEYDGLMAYEGDTLPRYAGLPYGDEMTLEWENSDSQLYEVNDLSISPILNPQHSGFLTIGNVPIENIQTSAAVGLHTTLSDTYQDGRLTLLPWAKVDGPGKLRSIEGQVFSVAAQSLPREVGYLPATSTLGLIEIRPDQLTVRQGLEGVFTVFLTDQFENPYAYETLDLEVFTDNVTFPGLLGVREFGIPSKLGTVVSAKTDPSGAVVASLLAPSEHLHLSMDTSDIVANKLTTIYKIGEVNHGNITMDVVHGGRVSLLGSETSEEFSLTVSGERYFADTVKIPTFNTIKINVPGTSDFDLSLVESLNQDITNEEFYVDYATGRVYLTNAHTTNIKVRYQPRLAWMLTSEPYAIQLDSSLVADITSDIIVRHDIKATVRVTKSGNTKDLSIIYRNPEL